MLAAAAAAAAVKGGARLTSGLLSRSQAQGCRWLLSPPATASAASAGSCHSTAVCSSGRAASIVTVALAYAGGAARATVPAATGMAGPWRAIRSAASAAATAGAAAGVSRQQARGFACYLQFQPRGSGWGGGGGGWADPDTVVKGLIGANLAGFLLWQARPHEMHTHATVSIEGLRAGRVWTVITSAFSHQGLMHLASNMIGLYFFGRDVGRRFGGKKLLGLYLAGAAVGSLSHCAYYFYQACKTGEGRYGRARWFGFTPSALGASAAVNSIVVLDILLNPRATVLLYGIIPMPAAVLGLLWLAQDIWGAAEGRGHIAHAGHLGGAAVGLAFFLAFKRGMIRPRGWY